MKAPYELDENAVKILIGSKLKDKALEWYRSRVEHLRYDINRIFQEMRKIFHHPVGKLERKKTFEAHEWQKNE